MLSVVSNIYFTYYKLLQSRVSSKQTLMCSKMNICIKRQNIRHLIGGVVGSKSQKEFFGIEEKTASEKEKE